MSVWYAASLVLLAPPLAEVTAREATPAVTVSAAELSPAAKAERVRRLREAADEILTKSAPLRKPVPEAVVPGLVRVYGALALDEYMADSERKRLQGRLRARLRQMEAQLLREGRRGSTPLEALTGSGSSLPLADGNGGNDSPASAAKSGPTNVSTGLPNNGILAQQFGPAGGMPGIGAGGANPTAGPNGRINLVTLIQQTIAPETWDVNGGNGTIMLYPPLNVLVISQSW